MLKVHCPVDCGNAPRKQVLKDFNIAFAAGDVDAVLSIVHDDIVWDIVGERRVEGKAAMRATLEAMKDSRATELHIHHIITHGNQAAAHGVLTFEGGMKYAFCDVYVFAGFSKTAELRQITSYGLELR